MTRRWEYYKFVAMHYCCSLCIHYKRTWITYINQSLSASFFWHSSLFKVYPSYHVIKRGLLIYVQKLVIICYLVIYLVYNKSFLLSFTSPFSIVNHRSFSTYQKKTIILKTITAHNNFFKFYVQSWVAEIYVRIKF